MFYLEFVQMEKLGFDRLGFFFFFFFGRQKSQSALWRPSGEANCVESLGKPRALRSRVASWRKCTTVWVNQASLEVVLEDGCLTINFARAMETPLTLGSHSLHAHAFLLISLYILAHQDDGQEVFEAQNRPNYLFLGPLFSFLFLSLSPLSLYFPPHHLKFNDIFIKIEVTLTLLFNIIFAFSSLPHLTDLLSPFFSQKHVHEAIWNFRTYWMGSTCRHATADEASHDGAHTHDWRKSTFRRINIDLLRLSNGSRYSE